MSKTKKEITIGLAGKYNELDDAYLSVIEASKSAGYFNDRKVNIEWIDTELIENKDESEWEKLRNVAGVIVPGGFGNRGTEGKVLVAEFCRTTEKPYLGICLGSQIMAIEFARNVLGLKDATSEEFDEEGKSKNHVIHFIPEQKNIRKKGGTMRLGAYDCKIEKGTRAYEIYGTDKISERHRHRYEFNDEFLPKFEGTDFVISGRNPQSKLVEIVEIKDHPFMVAGQFHPELISRPFEPHPLFRDFVKVAAEKN